MKKQILIAVSLSFAACRVGPDYRKPERPSPETWSESKGEKVASETADLTHWWTNFGDPTLDSLIERAIAANLDLKAAEARVREARAQAGFARGALYPEVDARGSAVRTRSSENGVVPLPDPETSLYSAGFDARWELDTFGGTRRDVEASDADVQASIEDRRSVLVSLVAEVAAAYVDLRGDQRLIAVVHKNIDAAKDTLELTRSRSRSGLATELDVARAEALLAGTEAPLPQYEADARISMHRLEVLLARKPGELASELGSVGPVPTPPEKILVGVPSELLARRPDVRRAERQLAAATARIGVATADRYPRFSLTGAFGLESVSTSTFADAASRAWSIGPEMRWPIFAGGRIEANIAVQDARTEQALHAYDQAMLVALEDVENSIVGYLREWDHRRSLETQAAAGRKSVTLAGDLYRHDLTNFIDVLDAERGLYDSELQLAQSEVATTLKVVSLYKALGGGWESAESMPTVAMRGP